ncbi:MAG: biopolymer transporter ExbD [Prevotella sp.]|nr:biopolymer transporter ExbD [Prevotella sp.]
MSMFRRRRRTVPTLNTASLPDLIFTVLFFFMIVTHMRKVTPKVEYQVPAGTELQRLTKKSSVSYIYIGTRADNRQTAIQLNDKFADAGEVANYVSSERERMSEEDRQQMTVSLKVDRHTPMGVVNDVKQSLRKANALTVNYSAVNKSAKK